MSGQSPSSSQSFVKRPEDIDDIALNIINTANSVNLAMIVFGGVQSYYNLYQEAALNLDDLCMAENESKWHDENWSAQRKQIVLEWRAKAGSRMSVMEEARRLQRLNVTTLLRKGYLRQKFTDENDAWEMNSYGDLPTVVFCPDCSMKIIEAEQKAKQMGLPKP